MLVKINKQLRKFKANTEIDLSFVKGGFGVMVGDNGSGKSTLIQCIRGMFPSRTPSLNESEYAKISKESGIEIEHDYEMILFFDSVLDNGTHFMNAYDATNLIKMGGYQKCRVSHGEGSLFDIDRFMRENSDKFIPNKTLIIFDEIDNGLSLKNMTLIINFILKLNNKFNCDVLLSTHNPFLIAQAGVCFDIEKMKMVSSKEYIKEKTGFYVQN